MKKFFIMLLLITTILLCPFAVLRADAAYQINISSNTEYAVFTLSYTGTVTGLQITSPNGSIYDQSTVGNAYQTTTGKIQVGIRYAEIGKWKILVSGSPDNGFQIMVTSDASFGDFAGTMPSETPTLQPTPTPLTVSTISPTPEQTSIPIPTPTPMPTPTLIPVQTNETIITTITPSSTNTPIPKQTKDTNPVTTQIPEAGSLTTIPRIVVTIIPPTITPEAAAIKVSETELVSSSTTKTEAGLLEEKHEPILSSFASNEVRRICCYVFIALLLIGIILVITKNRNRIRTIYYQIGIQRFDKNQKERIRLQQQAAESSRLRKQRLVEAEAAQTHARKMKEEAVADADLFKKKKNNEAEISRLHALQVKTTVEALRIQRRQEKEEEKSHIKKTQKEEREAVRCVALQLKENANAVRIQRKKEKLEEKIRVKEKRTDDSAKAKVITKQKKENAADARIQQHISDVAKNRDNRVKKRNAFLRRVDGLHKKTPAMQSQQERQLRLLFESQLEKERIILVEMEIEAKARTVATKESRGMQ